MKDIFIVPVMHEMSASMKSNNFNHACMQRKSYSMQAQGVLEKKLVTKNVANCFLLFVVVQARIISGIIMPAFENKKSENKSFPILGFAHFLFYKCYLQMWKLLEVVILIKNV
jgi:hypothetical protein